MIISAVTSGVSNTCALVGDAVAQIPFHLSQIGYREDRKYEWLKYWPSYLSGSIATAATIATIASVLFHNIAQAIVYGAIALGTLILATTLHVFIPLKRLEDQIADNDRVNKAFRERIKSLEGEVHAVQELKEGIDKKLTELRSENEDVNRRIKASQDDLAQKMLQLSTAERKARCLEQLLTSIQQADASLERHAQEFEVLGRDIAHNGEEIVHASGNFNAVTTTLATQLKSLEQQKGVVVVEFESAVKFANSLSTLFQSMQVVYRGIKGQVDGLRTEIARLQQEVHEVHGEAEVIDGSVEALQRFVEEAKKQNPFH